MKRATVLDLLGRPGEALDAYGVALAEVEAGPDRVLEARLRCNRSIVLAYQGRTAEALIDAEIAERLASAHEQWFLAGGSAHNHAFTAGLHGDLVAALASFARADAWYSRVGYPGRSAGVLASDRCEVLLAAGLAAEARASAERAVESLDFVADVVDLAEARLLLARACLAAGDRLSARREAATAHEAFIASDRRGWAIVAEFVAFSAAHSQPETSELPDLDLDQARQIADDLDRLGWPAESASVRVAAAEIAIRRGEVRFAREQLDTAGSARSMGRADRRASAWLATSRLRSLEGNRSGAKRAALAGLDIVAQHQMTLGATDLRVGAMVHARDLAAAGLSMALESGRPRDVLAWAERVRANALAVPSVRPPDDVALASALVELRRLRSTLDGDRGVAGQDGALADAIRCQELLIRDLARVAQSSSRSVDRFSVAALQSRLRGRHLVEYVESDGVVAAVVVDGRRCRLHSLAAAGPVAELVDQAAFALGRLARSGSSLASMDAAADSLVDALAQLDELLVAPLGLPADAGADGRNGGVVVVPTGVLHGLPWGGLASLRGRAVTLAMSARRWTGEPASTVGDETVAVIAGPDLVDPGGDVASVTSTRSNVQTLTGTRATVAAALELLDSSDTAHLACHGSFRSDSPMFSSLTLADGPLTIYDLETLATPPSLVVLPACNAGASAVSAGDEVIGTASALLGTGVRTVIAPISVVNDAVTVEVMRLLHGHLAAGLEPAAALAATRADADRLGRVAGATATSFLCVE